MTDAIEPIESIVKSSECYNGNAKVKIVMIGPKEAKALLDHNDSLNRDMKKKNYRKYARYMNDEEFMLSNDALTFDEEGVLINGQNRLKAVIDSGCTVPFIVVYNVPKETKNIINNGSIVTNSDRQKMFLKTIGLNMKDAWGTICEILSAESGGVMKKQDYTMEVKTVEEFAEANKTTLKRIFSRDYVKKNRPGRHREHFGVASSTTAMRLEYMLTEHGDDATRETARQFFDDIDTQNRPTGSPIGLLQDWFLDRNKEMYAGHGGECVEIAIMIAFDAYRRWKTTGKSGLDFIDVNRDKKDSNGNVVMNQSTGKPEHELKREFIYLNYIKSN
jgi:hypothetical protein